jgi:translation initiation factor IF-1
MKNEFDGIIIEALPNTMFKAKLDDERVVLVTLTGRVRRKFRRIMPGDRVKIELTPYEENKGRVVHKFNK